MCFSPASAQTPAGTDLDETARALISRYVTRTILQDAELDMSRVPALRADWPTDLKLALALDTSSETQLGLQVDSVKTHLPILSERLKNELYVESWLRNRVAEMRDASLQRSTETLELRLNESAVARVRGAIRARTRLRASLGETLAGFEQTFAWPCERALEESRPRAGSLGCDAGFRRAPRFQEQADDGPHRCGEASQAVGTVTTLRLKPTRMAAGENGESSLLWKTRLRSQRRQLLPWRSALGWRANGSEG